MEKMARCMKCKQFDKPERMVVLKCPSCVYVTYRHKDEDCGGAEGALRSIRGHFIHFLRRANEEGNHREAIARASRYIVARLKARL